MSFYNILAYGLVALSFTACSTGKKIAKKQPINRAITVKSAEFSHQLKNIVKVPWKKGNHVTTLVNGDQFFSEMLQSIRSAKKTITFETFAYVNGYAAYEFTAAFCKQARAGVKVHVLLDSLGSANIGKENIQRMQNAGVELLFYHPFSLLHPWQYNTRDHRKIMVVDGKTGYTGGCGVADAWKGNAENSKQWRENHYKVTGRAVAQLQQAFLDNWHYAGGSQLSGSSYFPQLAPTGNVTAQAFNSDPKDELYTIPHLYRQAIASARESIAIENSYFSPDQTIMNELYLARKRGVQVMVLLPGKHIDSWPVRCSARSHYKKMLAAGIKIYEYQATMLHCKVLVIDGYFSSVGSANFDARSLYINDESNLNVLDENFALKQLQLIDKDTLKSKRITTPRSLWNPLTLPKRLFSYLLTPQL